MSRLTALYNKIANEPYDAVIITSEVNQKYITGFDFTDGYVVVTKEKAFVLVDFRYIEAARAKVSDEFEILMLEGKKIDCVKNLLAENGVRILAYENLMLTCEEYNVLSDALEGVGMLPAKKLFDSLRICKTDEELEIMDRAQQITDAAFEHILKFIKPDMTEIEVALELEFFMRKMGSKGIAFDTICVSGSASSLPHGEPRNVKLEKGFLTMDFGARVDGYCADMTRTIVIGKADDEMKKLYNTVLQAQTEALAAIRAGECGYDIDNIARTIINNAGYRGCFGHGLGHGVGLFIHEAPRLSPMAEGVKLEVGNVVTVEPGIYLEGKYGCRIEDMVAVTEDGIRNFTKSPKELIEIF